MTNEYGAAIRYRLDSPATSGGAGWSSERDAVICRRGTEARDAIGRDRGSNGSICNSGEFSNYAHIHTNNVWGISTRTRIDRPIWGNSSHWPAASYKAGDKNGRLGHGPKIKQNSYFSYWHSQLWKKIKHVHPVLLGSLMMIIITLGVLFAVGAFV